MRFKSWMSNAKEQLAGINRKVKVLAIVSGSVFMLLMAGMVGTYAFFSHRLSAGYIPVVEAPASFYEVLEVPDLVEIPYDEVYETDWQDFEVEARLVEPVAPRRDDYIFERAEIDERIFSFLFIGDDARIHEPRGRSDALLVASFNRDTGEIFLTSILRDTLVPLLDDNNSWDGINHAYFLGGAGRAINVINNALSLDIQHYVALRFSDIFELTDRLGGLVITLRQDEADVLNSIFPDYVTLSEGTHLLNGRQVLAFSRMRRVDGRGDFGRVERQQQVLRSVLNRLLDVNSFGDIMTLADFSLNHVTTNIPLSTILTLAFELFTTDNVRLHTMRVPIDGSFARGSINGAALISMNFETNIRAVHEFVFGTSVGVRIPVFERPAPLEELDPEPGLEYEPFYFPWSYSSPMLESIPIYEPDKYDDYLIDYEEPEHQFDEEHAGEF